MQNAKGSPIVEVYQVLSINEYSGPSLYMQSLESKLQEHFEDLLLDVNKMITERTAIRDKKTKKFKLNNTMHLFNHKNK